MYDPVGQFRRGRAALSSLDRIATRLTLSTATNDRPVVKSDIYFGSRFGSRLGSRLELRRDDALRSDDNRFAAARKSCWNARSSLITALELRSESGWRSSTATESYCWSASARRPSRSYARAR